MLCVQIANKSFWFGSFFPSRSLSLYLCESTILYGFITRPFVFPFVFGFELPLNLAFNSRQKSRIFAIFFLWYKIRDNDKAYYDTKNVQPTVLFSEKSSIWLVSRRQALSLMVCQTSNRTPNLKRPTNDERSSYGIVHYFVMKPILSRRLEGGHTQFYPLVK